LAVIILITFTKEEGLAFFDWCLRQWKEHFQHFLPPLVGRKITAFKFTFSFPKKIEK